ncbi:hypothetical protein KL938_004347 [Ogataea parapolymorpha]|nr:hypothetical protein KL938_004347 [Ogataea parapolymorpha]
MDRLRRRCDSPSALLSHLVLHCKTPFACLRCSSEFAAVDELYEHERHHKQPVVADPLRADLVSYRTASLPRLRGQCPKIERKIAQLHQQLVHTYTARPQIDTATLPATALEQYAAQLEQYHAKLERLHQSLSAELAATDRQKRHYWLKTQRLVDALHQFEKTELNI